MTSDARERLADREYVDGLYEDTQSSDSLYNGAYGVWWHVKEEHGGNVTLTDVKTALDYHGIADFSNTSLSFRRRLERYDA